MGLRKLRVAQVLVASSVVTGAVILVLQRDPLTTLPEAAPRPVIMGTGYDYQVPHCGLGNVVEFDGDYWDVDRSTMTTEENQRFGINADRGTLTLVDPDVAVYRSAAGGEATLRRHAGRKAVSACL